MFFFEETLEAPPPIHQPINFLSLPGFSEAKKGLEEKGMPSAWITETVDTTEKCAFFCKGGRPWYKSQCEHYEGYWLLGGIGSVQCSACRELLPGLMWQTTCREQFENCPFYSAGG